jgi:hypothetical protein
MLSEQFSFYGVRPGGPLDLSGMGDPTSSYATAGIALRVSRALKPHHHDKMETPSVGLLRRLLEQKFIFNLKRIKFR